MVNTEKITLDEGIKTGDKDLSYTHFVDLSVINLAEDQTSFWIQAMPIGNYSHPVHGPINITVERVQKFADQVKSGIRGQDINIDYDHKEGLAAGWVKDAVAKSDGLYVLVEWTKSAANHIREGAYRYFSPEIWSRWTHPVTKREYSDVLVGGAITNRPFLKGIQPLILNEESGNLTMNRKALEALAKKHGIEFDESTSDADLQTKVEEAASTEDFNVEVDDDDDGDDSEDDSSADDANDEENELVSLSEEHPVVAGLIAKLNESTKRIAAVEAGARVADVKVQLAELDSSTAALSPVVKQQLSDLMITAPKATADKILKLAQTIMEDGVVQLGELGGKTEIFDLGGKSASQMFSDKVEKLRTDDKDLSYADASIQLAESEPELWNAYNTEVYTTEGAD